MVALIKDPEKIRQHLPWFLGSKVRLFLYFLIIFSIPIFATVSLLEHQIRGALQQQSERQSKVAARLVAQAAVEHFEGLMKYAESYSRRAFLASAYANKDGGNIEAQLRQLVSQNVTIDRAFIASLKGIEEYDYPHDPAVIGKDFSYRDWYKGVAASGRTYLSGIYKRAGAPQLDVVAVATTLFDTNGKALGYLVLQIRTKDVLYWLDQAQPALHGPVWLADQFGRVLQSPTTSPLENILSLEERQKALTTDLMLHKTDSLTGVRYHIHSVPIPEIGWSAAIGIPERAICAPMAPLRPISLLIGITLFIILVMTGFISLHWMGNYHKALVFHADDAQRSVAFLEKIINSIADPIFVKDRQHRWVLLNDALCRFMGHAREELIGKSDYEFFPKDEADVFWEKDECVFKTGQENLNEEEFTDSSGHVYTISTKKTLYTDKDENLFIVGIIRDITEKKRADEALLKSTAELARSKAEREQLELFAYVASHDLQEPLQTIIGFSDLLDRDGQCSNKDAPLFIKKIRDAARRMSRLIDDLLKFSKTIRQIECFSEIDLEKSVKEVVADFEPKIKQVGAKVKIGHLPKIRGEASQIRQLFQNLLSNALKFCQADPVIEINSKELPDKEWEISVRDNGIGFDQGHAERLFKPFERFHDRKQYEGTGIGLAICSKIVMNHYGKIRAKSKIGSGTTFFVVLPKLR